MSIPNVGCWSLADYMNAPSGVGPLSDEWLDKPHRLVYDLCAVIRLLHQELEEIGVPK